MADPALHGNGEACPACALRREMQAEAGEWPAVPACNRCGGSGRLGFSEARIVAETVAEARARYWPAVEARWAEMGA